MSKKPAINNFRVGDIIEICLDPKGRHGDPEWIRYGSIRDNEDVEWAKALVASDGGSLGMYSALLAREGTYPRLFRTVTP